MGRGEHPELSPSSTCAAPTFIPHATSRPSMALRLHRHGRFRAWLGAALGGDEELGDRVWRRVVHTFGATVLVYYVFPNNFFVVAPKADILLALLALVIALEVLRHTVGLQLPTIRPYEDGRVASFVFYSVALVIAVLLFPLPIGAAVVLGTAIVDPVAGELRSQGAPRLAAIGIPLGAYGALAFVGLAAIGGWPAGDSALLAAAAAPLAIAAERPKWSWVDDDLLMTIVPALFLYGVGVLALGLPG